MTSDSDDNVEITGVNPPPLPMIKPNDPIIITVNKAEWQGKLLHYSHDGTMAFVKYDNNKTGEVDRDQIKPAFDANAKPTRARKTPERFSDSVVIATISKRKISSRSLMSPPAKKQKSTTSSPPVISTPIQPTTTPSPLLADNALAPRTPQTGQYLTADDLKNSGNGEEVASPLLHVWRTHHSRAIVTDCPVMILSWSGGKGTVFGIARIKKSTLFGAAANSKSYTRV